MKRYKYIQRLNNKSVWGDYMFNPLYRRICLNDKIANKLEDRIIYNHVFILPDGREILVDTYNPRQGGWGLIKYPLRKIRFKNISELLKY